MCDASDEELLRDYCSQGSDDAFAELVRRHIDLVYSAAIRHVGIAEHAEEITQAVFIIFSKKAVNLRPDRIIDAWLYETTRLTSLSFLRGERRRQLRERKAFMQSTLERSDDVALWDQLAPLLDEAMAGLSRKDREAVVLRFFRDKSLNEVAATLKITEAAAQSRVHRAVKKLQSHFLRRGINSTIMAITGAISANSIQAAPAILAKNITAIVLAKGVATSASTLNLIKGALKVMAWTKTKTAGVSAVIFGMATYSAIQHHVSVRLREQNEMFRQQQLLFAEQIQQLQKERDEATNQLSSLVVENQQLKFNPHEGELLKLRGQVSQLISANSQAKEDPTELAAKSWTAKVYQLRQHLMQNPMAYIPELEFATEGDWLNAAGGNLETDTDYRKAYALLRQEAENRVASDMLSALQTYFKTNNGRLPTDLSELEPYFHLPIDASILQRWTIVNNQVGQPNEDWSIAQKAPVDEQYDSRVRFGLNLWETQPWSHDGELTIPVRR